PECQSSERGAAVGDQGRSLSAQPARATHSTMIKTPLIPWTRPAGAAERQARPRFRWLAARHAAATAVTAATTAMSASPLRGAMPRRTRSSSIQLLRAELAVAIAVECVEQRERVAGEFVEVDAIVLVPVHQRRRLRGVLLHAHFVDGA